ncbi:hypothetical protein [Streptosporangium lutulentum]|uniref:Uncharacterized protein n=1 Tax=Streptosporangium lutulentum TaxID=1461250 RepID=A0ABT9Q3B9_9ACTN|nr:hypothetical protein [Streptosporangium lutulentum]MDP9841214.1 hypothetical protein [Streptosporangium lutulentum]
MTALDAGPFGAFARSVVVETGWLLENPLAGTGSTALTATFR